MFEFSSGSSFVCVYSCLSWFIWLGDLGNREFRLLSCI